MNYDQESVLLEKAELMLSNDKLLEAISLIEDINANGVESEITLLKARIIELKRKGIRGTISHDGQNIELNKIRIAILEMISLVRKLKSNNSIRKKHLVLVSELINIIDTNFNTWKSQTKLKEKLIKLLDDRFDLEKFDTPYDLFSSYFSRMNEHELRLHSTIRGYTRNIIYPNNLKIIKIIKDNNSLKQVHSDILYLEQHLTLWKSKYDTIFEQDKSTCLIFVGLEENMRFPPNLLSELKQMVNSRNEVF